MKKTLLAIMIFVCCSLAGKAQTLSVFSVDYDGPYTNIRNAPKGAIVSKVKTSEDAMFEVTSPRNGWWRIVGDSYDLPDREDIMLKGSSKGYWIHYSTIGIGTRNYGGQTLTLRSTPGGKAVYSFKEEITLRPIDIKGGWVKVKTVDGKHTGWIEEEWLCGNPLTNCC